MCSFDVNLLIVLQISRLCRSHGGFFTSRVALLDRQTAAIIAPKLGTQQVKTEPYSLYLDVCFFPLKMTSPATFSPAWPVWRPSTSPAWTSILSSTHNSSAQIVKSLKLPDWNSFKLTHAQHRVLCQPFWTIHRSRWDYWAKRSRADSSAVSNGPGRIVLLELVVFFVFFFGVDYDHHCHRHLEPSGRWWHG